jgi:hypothetical protein
MYKFYKSFINHLLIYSIFLIIAFHHPYVVFIHLGIYMILDFVWILFLFSYIELSMSPPKLLSKTILLYDLILTKLLTMLPVSITAFLYQCLGNVVEAILIWKTLSTSHPVKRWLNNIDNDRHSYSNSKVRPYLFFLISKNIIIHEQNKASQWYILFSAPFDTMLKILFFDAEWELCFAGH